MNKKDALLEEVVLSLLKKGFAVKGVSRGFDILASKDKRTLLIKVLKDGNAITKESAMQLLSVASLLNVYPLLIALNTGFVRLADNVFYSRFNLPMVNFGTFKSLINNKPIFFRSTKAGIIAVINGTLLRKKREELNMSLNDVSRRIGVSRKMVYKYEKQVSQVTPNKALSLYDLFGPNIFKTINLQIERPNLNLKESVFARKYKELGFDAFDTSNMPFNIIAKYDEDIVLTEVNSTKPKTRLISKLLNVNSLFIFKKKVPDSVPAISKEDFLSLKKAKDLLDFLKGFSRL